MNTNSSAFLRALCASAVSLFSASALAQDLSPKAPAQTKPIAIVNATIHTITSDTINDGYIRFDKGRITGVGLAHGLDIEGLKRQGYEVIDAQGQNVYPGLIAPYTQLGLTEISAVRATLDYGEVGSVTPEVRAVVAVNPDSTLIPVTRSNGVLTVGVFPITNPGGLINYFDGPGGLMPGRPGVIRLDGWTWEDMTVRDDIGVVVNWPQARPIVAWWMNRTEEEQQKEIDAQLEAIEKFITDAKAYWSARAEPQAAPENESGESRAARESLPIDLRFEGMKSVLLAAPGSALPRPLYIHAEDYDQLTQAVSFCVKHKLRCVIIGGRDAPLCADLLKRHDVPVIIPGTIRFPKRDDSPYDDAYTLPARLDETGVKFCIASGEEAAHERNLPYSAALAVAHGLSPTSAIKSITLWPAEILGIAKDLGTLESGKSATLIITDGDPLEITTNVQRAFIDGREIDLSNKQTKLDEKYRERYRQKDAASTPK